jgi:hypothetical protein
MINNSKPTKTKNKEPKNIDRICDKNYLIVGLSVKVINPDPMTMEIALSGSCQREIISYDYFWMNHEGVNLAGQIVPEDDDRISLKDYIQHIINEALSIGKLSEIPSDVYIVTHTTRKQLSTFSDFHKFKHSLRPHNNSLTTFNTPISELSLDCGQHPEPNVYVRDIALLTADGDKADLELILESVLSGNSQLSSTVNTLRSAGKKESLDALTCCAMYDCIVKLNNSIPGSKRFPSTLNSIGVDLICNIWDQIDGSSVKSIRGFKEEYQKIWNKKFEQIEKKKITVPSLGYHWHESLFVECYHGGRNEQYYVGPTWKSKFYDYDLVSAYPTAMALIGRPNWDNAKVSACVDDYTATTLGFAHIKFKYPNWVRYPGLPVNVDGSLIFPLEGESCCAAPEIAAAVRLGATIEILYGVIVPTDEKAPIFKSFVELCLKERGKYPKKNLMNSLWKSIVNSTYGKLAQGLPKKRIDHSEGNAPQSRITNACFASFTSSYVRAVLTEVMNAIPSEHMIFSCTTDGFITDAPDAVVQKALAGPLSQLYAASRESLTGEGNVLEIKHVANRLLGLKNRGQVTLEPGTTGDEAYDVIIAKAGISLPKQFESRWGQSEKICSMFFQRSHACELEVTSLIDTSEILKYEIDCVEIVRKRKINMEYDFKRKPNGYGVHPRYDDHLVFNTAPWPTSKDYKICRDLWETYRVGSPFLKAPRDLELFFNYLQTKVSVPEEKSKNIPKTDGDLMRLRRVLCFARANKLWGLGASRDILIEGETVSVKTNADFASLLTRLGIETKRTHVEYGLRLDEDNVAYSCPPSELCVSIFDILVQYYPEIEYSFIFGANKMNEVFDLEKECQFIAKVEAEVPGDQPRQMDYDEYDYTPNVSESVSSIWFH